MGSISSAARRINADRWTARLTFPLRLSLLVATSAALNGCQAEYRDVSHVAPHKQRLGQICIAATQVRAHGVTTKVEHEKKTDYVLVSELRFTGPEFTFAEPIQAEARFRLVSARQCSNCPFEESVQYGVDIQPTPERLVGLPVYVRDTTLSSNSLHCE